MRVLGWIYFIFLVVSLVFAVIEAWKHLNKPK